MTDIAKDIHVFEKSGCGIAPFKLIGMWQMPSKSLQEANPDAYNNAIRTAPIKGIGCCAHCWTGIIYHYIIQDVNGKQFVVGSECVNKTGDSGLISRIKEMKKEVAKVKREAKIDAKLAQRKADLQERKNNWIKNTTQGQEIIDFLTAEVASENCYYLWSNFYYSFQQWGNLSGNQCNCVTIEIAKRLDVIVNPPATSEYVGVHGKKMTIKVLVDKILTIPAQQFSYNDRSSQELYMMTDDKGNKIICYSKSLVANPTEGEWYMMTCTIKFHKEYKGIKQTIINRPKWSTII